MNHRFDSEKLQQNYQNSIKTLAKKPYILSSYIITLPGSDTLPTHVLALIELGVTMVRFQMAYATREIRINMLRVINEAIETYRVLNKRYTVPICIGIDIPNACIKTGVIKDDINDTKIFIKEKSEIEITSNPKCWNKCDHKLIFIDDPYTITSVKPGTEVSVNLGEIVMICTEVLNATSIKCRVIKAGKLKSMDFVCFRGIKHTKPILSKTDLDLIEFAKEFKADVVTINSLRRAETLINIKGMFAGVDLPLIMSSICEQEGLDNIDEIIKVSDGIILAREFLACEIVDKYKMMAIQLAVGSKCKQKGIPFFISGSILDASLRAEALVMNDSTDVTNAFLQGAGLVLRCISTVQEITEAVRYINDIAKNVEALQMGTHDFWRMIDEFHCPVLALKASIVGCAIMAKQRAASAIIVITVSGFTPVALTQLVPDIPILAVSKNPAVARKMQMYRGIIPLIYDRHNMEGWMLEMEERIQFAIDYAIKYDILRYGNIYVTLRKSTSNCIFADNVSTYVVTTEGYHSPTVCPIQGNQLTDAPITETCARIDK